MQDCEFYEYRDVKNDLKNTNVDATIRRKTKDPIGGSGLSTHTNFLTMMSISLFCCCKRCLPIRIHG